MHFVSYSVIVGNLMVGTLTPALKAAANPIIWDPDGGGNFWCVQQDDVNRDYCGGADSDDPWAQLSCTPYTYRPNTFNIINEFPIGTCGDGDWRENDHYLNIMTNGANYGDSAYPNVDTNAWAGNFEWEGNYDYWVFHGCDGAGLQSDCLGDIKYIERLSYRWYDEYYGIWDGEGTIPSQGICSGWDESDHFGRNYCKFVHPGTLHVYSDYKAGWWGIDCGEGHPQMGSWNMGCIMDGDFSSAASGPWSGPLKDNVMSIPQNYFNGMHPFQGDGHNFSFLLFPWRCEWGHGIQHNLFSYPTITDPGWKCFVDNEPDGGSPPYIEIYFGTLSKDEDGKNIIKLYRFDSDPDGNVHWMNEWQPYILWPVHMNDGSWVPY